MKITSISMKFSESIAGIFLSISGKYYPEDEEDEGPGISTVIGEHLTNMTRAMSVAVTTKTMLDVESKVANICRVYLFAIQEMVLPQIV